MVSLFDEFGGQVSGHSNQTRYNIAPTENAPIIRQHQGKNELCEARWWLVPNWSDGPSSRYAMFNARCENLESSRAFKEPFRYQRCIIPASSYIEWQAQGQHKQAYEIYADEPFLFAGIWDEWQGKITSCSMITMPASEALSDIHKRMPVMFNREQAVQWLDEKTPVDLLKRSIQNTQTSDIHYRAIDNDIGKVKNKNPPQPVVVNQSLF